MGLCGRMLIIQKDRFLRVFVIYAFRGEKEVSVDEAIVMSERELKEKLEKINKLLVTLNIKAKSAIKHINELINTIDTEAFKTNIDVKEYIKLLEDALNNIEYVTAEFIEKLVYAEIDMYAADDMYDKYGFEESDTDRDLGIVIIEDLNKPAMIYTDYRKVNYYVKE